MLIPVQLVANDKPTKALKPYGSEAKLHCLAHCLQAELPTSKVSSYSVDPGETDVLTDWTYDRHVVITCDILS